MIKQLESQYPNVLAFEMSDTLHDEDYKEFVPIVEESIKGNDKKINFMAVFKDFHGWDAHACWDDLKFGVKHCFDIKKIALVGDKTWEKWMALICKPFTVASVRYFDISEIKDAWSWLEEN